MPRLTRLPSIPFGWYYVALRAKNGRGLVTNSADLKMFLDLLRVTLQKKGAHLHAACVTRNEAHLAVQSGEASVSEMTRSLCHEYARLFNRRYAESGGLFRPHPHVLLIQQRLWLVPLAHFIHWIPRLRALQSGASEYSWSTDSVYRGRARREGLITHVVLHIVSEGARRREVQEQAYRERFDDAPDPDHIRLFAHGSLEDPRVLGDREFMEEVWRTTHQQSPRRKRVASQNKGIRDEVVRAVERFGALCDEALPRRQAGDWKRIVTLEQLCSHSRKRPLPMIRAVCASHMIKRNFATRAQMASFFGCSPETLSAHRRRHYAQLFSKWFGTMPGMPFWSGPDRSAPNGAS